MDESGWRFKNCTIRSTITIQISELYAKRQNARERHCWRPNDMTGQSDACFAIE